MGKWNIIRGHIMEGKIIDIFLLTIVILLASLSKTRN